MTPFVSRDTVRARMVTRADSAKPSIFLVGARGYAGQQLARLLLRHPAAILAGVSSTDSGWKLSDAIPDEAARVVPSFPVTAIEESARKVGASLAFLATPTETSLELAPKLLANGISVIDLSGAYRLVPSEFQTAYGLRHPEPARLNPPPFGLVPWAKSTPWKKGEPPRLIANPGCYSTSVLLALIPLLRDKLIEPDSIVIDAKSGATGAGRKAAENLLFTEIGEDCIPYRVARHQHEPEVEAWSAHFSGTRPDLCFTTHLLPVRRGILSSIYARLADGADEAAIAKSFQKAYEKYPLVRSQALCDGNGKENVALLSLKKVVGSARTHLSFHVSGNRLFLFSTIDNLMKGAASQAVENMNGLLGLPPETGLLEWEGTL